MTKERKQFKQIQNQSQEGRSMVEMLGVLAIIGVLSIGGIVGYRMAMNHYQANQIAHEINLMRTDAKVKIAQGMTKLLLGSPYDDEKHLNFNANYGVQVDFPVTITDETGENEEDGYSFTLSGIPAGVCKPLATLLDGMDDTAALEINGNENNECDEAAESNTITVFFDTDTTTAVGDCSEHGELKYYSGSDPNEKWAVCVCEEGYTGDRCEKETKECTSNTDCGANQYCYFNYSRDCTEQTGYTGKCKSNTPDAKIEVNGKTFFAKFDGMSWWSAQNFCASHHGKQMASVSDLDCAKAKYSCLSDTIKELSKKMGEYYWLSDLYNSCLAYGVKLNSGGVDYYGRGTSTYYHAFYALCAPKTE